jgi:hypothetical protein
LRVIGYLQAAVVGFQSRVPELWRPFCSGGL